MKTVKEDEQMKGPLFPRLHVKDAADKGGPRAPPRNKMALYEQLSIPSQRFNSAAGTPMLSLLPHASASGQGGHERTKISHFYPTSEAPVNSAGKVHDPSPKGKSITRMESQKGSAKHIISQNSLTGTELAAECSLPSANKFYKVKSSCITKYDDDDDLRAPTFVHSKRAAQLNKDRTAVETQKFTAFHANAPRQCKSTAVDSPNLSPTSYDKSSEHLNDSSKNSRQHEGKHIHLRSNTALLKENKVKPSTDSEILEKSAEFSRPHNFSHVQEGMQAVKYFGNSENVIGDLFQSDHRDVGLGGSRHLSEEDLGECEDVVIVRNESCLKTSHEGNSQPAVGNCNRKCDAKTGSLQSKDADKKDDLSEASMVDSLSGLEISPDDVAGLIGSKQFWKARRAIVNQQRVFAVQVFELHRLIKVQKLIAASPQVLLQDYPCLDESVPKAPTKNLSFKATSKLPPSVKSKDDMEKQNTTTRLRQDYNTIRAPHLLSNADFPNKQHSQVPRTGTYSGNPPPTPLEIHLQHSQAPRTGTYSGNPPPTPLVHENNPNHLFLRPPANQWLVPVMSPTEGLIYKPYTGPYPPGAGSVAPIYDIPAYGNPASHQQQNMSVFSGAPGIRPSYFPTSYTLPVVNPIISASAGEHVSPMVAFRPKNRQIGENSRSSCNMPNSKGDKFSGCLWRFQASKGSEIQGSTASSPCDKSQGERSDALPLFPMAPAPTDSSRPSESHDKGSNQTRVIKVVPCKARYATESAARIFRSIQEERQQ